ncbi:hypothetical protein [Methylosinus sp. Ce-a6]|nr:hypothetical protein [Methylosinus sp. Ce-a6]
MRKVALSTVAGLVASPAFAVESEAAAPPPGGSFSAAREFDFH